MAGVLKVLPFVHTQRFFYREHGIQAELPFIKHYFPNATITAITLKASTPRTELDQLTDVLKKSLSSDTMIIQSTDFSHYLTPEAAAVHDSKTLDMLEKSDTNGLFSLNQPDHLDSIASQYIQMRLQKELFSSHLSILAHKNSQDYTTERVSSSTSYITQGYTKNDVAMQTTSLQTASIIFLGDIMMGRAVARVIDKQSVRYPFEKIHDYLHTADIVFANLEGPITKGPPVKDNEMVLHDNPGAEDGLSYAGISVVSLANNHTPDYGAKGIVDTIKALDAKGILHTGAGNNLDQARTPAIITKNGITIAFLAYTDFDVVPQRYGATTTKPGTNFMDIKRVSNDVASVRKKASIVIVSMHSGKEYSHIPDAFQREFAHAAIDAGADMVIGHHPHVIQSMETYKKKYIFYSLGNTIFDQSFSRDTQEGMTVRAVVDSNGVVSIQTNPIVISPTFQAALINDPRVIKRINTLLLP